MWTKVAIKQILVALMFAGLMMPVQAQAIERFLAGSHYQVVGDENAPKPKKPHVTEFFSYGCPHCEHLEPLLKTWYESKQGTIEFQRVPAQWSSYFEILAQLYFTLEHLGVAEEHSPTVFKYIHEQRKPLRKEAQIIHFAEKQLKIPGDTFIEAWNSGEVKQGMAQASKALRQYRVSGVPAMLVNHRYYVSVKMAGSEEAMFEVVDFLLTK